MNKILLTDIDDALVVWSKHFRREFRKSTGHTPSAYDSSETNAYKHIPIPELEKHIIDFNTSHHFENLQPKANSVEILKKLKSEGWTIVGITACGRRQDMADLRWKNMNKVYGEGTFSDIRFINWYECKSEHLKDFENCPFVDDNIKHAETALRMGHRPIIIHRSYRRKFKHSQIPYVMDWDEVYRNITK